MCHTYFQPIVRRDAEGSICQGAPRFSSYVVIRDCTLLFHFIVDLITFVRHTSAKELFCFTVFRAVGESSTAQGVLILCGKEKARQAPYTLAPRSISFSMKEEIYTPGGRSIHYACIPAVLQQPGGNGLPALALGWSRPGSL